MQAEYFRLRQSKKATNPIAIFGIDKGKYRYKMDKAAFDALGGLAVAYYQNSMGMEICDFLQSPCFMIADRFKDIFALLEPSMKFKGVQLFPHDFDKQTYNELARAPMPMYQVPYIEPTSCLHESAKIYGTGTVRTLVLEEGALEGRHVVKIAGLVEEIWIISLLAAESILRRRPLAAGLERVEVK